MAAQAPTPAAVPATPARVVSGAVVPNPVAIVAAGAVVAGLTAAQRVKVARAIRRDRLRLEAYCTPAALQAFHRDPSRKRSLRGPNQGGKSWAGAKEALWLMGAHQHPFRDQYNVRRPWTSKPVRGWVVCYSEKQSRAIQAALYRLVPRRMLVSTDFNESRGFLNGQLILTNGSILEVKTVGQDTLGLASATLDFVWIDEPPPENVYGELLSRLLVLSGSLWITYTPIGRPVGWLKKLCEAGEISDHRFSLDVENCPHLTAAQIDEQVRDILPHERAQRIHGEWEGVTPDRMLDQFTFPEGLHGTFQDKGELSNVINVREWMPPGALRVLVGFDWGEGAGKTTAVAVALRPARSTPLGRIPAMVWALGEYVSPGATTIEQDARGTRDMLRRLGLSLAKVDVWVGDVNTAGKSSVGTTVNELMAGALAELARVDLAAAGHETAPGEVTIRVETADKRPGSVDYGNRMINVGAGRRLLFLRGGEDGRGKFGATSLITAVKHWQGGKTGKDGEYTHILDAFRYVFVRAVADDMEYSYLRVRYS